jgi:hypothetical protein
MVAMANHSCEPNAVVVFPNGGRCMELIAIRDIEPNEEVSRCWESTNKQILTSYIDVSLPVEKRQSELEATYRFNCECSLCIRDVEIRSPGYEGVAVDLRAAVWHRDCKRKLKGKGSLPIGWENQGEHLERSFGGKLNPAETNSMRCVKCKEHFNLNISELLGPYQRATTLLEADAKGRDGQSTPAPSAGY